jgi:hypothetical protein
VLTNTGKNILAKYLIGQTPAYASYIAFGCGARPLDENSGFGNYSDKTSLDFEMFRSPIISRGYVSDVEQATISSAVGDGEILTCTGANTFRQGDTVDIVGLDVPEFNVENAVIVSATPTSFTIASSKSGSSVTGGLATKVTQSIVFTAQLPTDERYEITEIGLYSAGANPSAGPADSRLLYSFNTDENWEYHDARGARYIGDPYQNDLSKYRDGTVPSDTNLSNSINAKELVFQVNTDNNTLNQSIRLDRNERSRFLNNTLFVRGDTSWLTATSESDVQVSTQDATHIHLNGISLDLDRNSGQDEIKVAFSVLNRHLDNSTPSEMNMIIDFVSADDLNAPGSQYARMRVRETSFDDRYFVASSKIDDLEKSPQFSWQAVNAIKIFVSVPTPTKEVLSKTIKDGVATIEFSNAHAYNVGGRVLLSNVESGLDGLHEITAIEDLKDSTTISISVPSLPDLERTTFSGGATAFGYSSQYYVALDAIRIENISTTNPLYGLVGYTVSKTQQGYPILKESNTSSLLEFRLAMDVI